MIDTFGPPGYHNPSFDLPAIKYVGVLACQRSPFLEDIITHVVSCEKSVPPPPSADSKKKKKDVAALLVADEYEIQLEDTVIFPEGGGQPSDTGRIHLTSVSPDQATAGVSNVRQALRKDLSAVHFCDSPLDVGAEVKVEIDMQRRLDHMDMHTSQHLISAIFDEIKVPTLAWSVSLFPAPSIIELDRHPTLAEIAFVQDRCNALIRENRTIRVFCDEAKGTEGRGEKMPEDYVGGVIRVVVIEGIDHNPCCGTHYPSLGYLQSIYLFPNTTSIRATNARISFIAGSRLLSHVATASQTVRLTSLSLGCATAEVSDRAAVVMINARESTRREKSLRDEVAGFVAQGVMDRAVLSRCERATLVGISYREEDATNDLDFTSLLSTCLLSLLPSSAPVESPHLFALMATSSSSHASPTSSIILVGTEGLVQSASKQIAAIFGDRIKGGGKTRWQGKIKDSRITNLERQRVEAVLMELA